MGFYDLSKEARKRAIAQMAQEIERDLKSGDPGRIQRFAADRDTYIRKNAYGILGRLYRERRDLRGIILGVLKRWLRDRNEKLRQTAVYSLGEVGKLDAEKVFEGLERALKDEHPAVRNAAKGALKQMGERNPKPTLSFVRGFLHHPDPRVRSAIIHGIELRGRKHPEDVLPLLAVAQGDPDRRVRETLVHVLSQISYKPGCLELVLAALKRWREKEVVNKALQAILDVHRRYEKFSAKSYPEARDLIDRWSLRLLWVLLALGCAQGVYAKEGDVRHILSHDKTLVVTDPAKGYKAYPRWAVFPSRATEYRKITLYVTYARPESLRCGEWDYIDGIYLRRTGGVGGPSRDIELARMISPYGWAFPPGWKFTWHGDLTDFASFLHDSVEIEFRHTGYESSADRGWLITLDFALTEGEPAMRVLGMDTLWCGSFPYGDSANPIANHLRPIAFTDTLGARVARLRIVQTGHGMDDCENCAEFCSKTRKVFFDDSLLAERRIWRRCGTNPLYPQAGTWIFDRANWCPGSMVYPDVYDHPIAPGSSHAVSLAMQPYLDRSKPTANYDFSSYLFFCAAPRAANDVSLEEILAPSTADEYSRLNPICSQPRIAIKNSGRNPLSSVVIKYGLSGEREQTYKWEGRLESQQSTPITLPGLLAYKKGGQQFRVALESPNGKKDGYPADNKQSSIPTVPPSYGAPFILALRTNSDSSHNAYRLFNQNGNLVRERKLGSLRANTLYRDTFDLDPGGYQLVVTDTAGDGLDFWYNPEGGYGFVRLLDMKGHLIKAFTSDFGSEIRHSFTVVPGAHPLAPTDDLPLVNPFPIRNPGKFFLSLFFNEPQNATVKIVNEDSTKTVFEKNYSSLKEDFLPLDISSQPDGFYFVKVVCGDKTVTKKIKVKHQD